ncbi:uncharacterized protein LOC142981848 isoform X6 [Anticarsia gemmatalis]
MVERNDAALREHAKVLAEEAFKREEKDKMLALNCQEPYMQYMEVPISNPSQILEGFFNATPDPVPAPAAEQEVKHDFEVEKLEPTPTPAKDKDGLNSDEENYLQLVVFQATSTVSPGRHVCNLCHKEFKHPRWLKQHMRSHTNWIKANCKKPPMCPICERTFKGPGMLKMHMRTHEQRAPKQPTCSVCQRTFASKTLLYRHRQTHFEQKTHLCSVCDKRFYSGYALRSHMARHRGERPYVCSTCNKSFYNPTDLKVRHHYRVTATRYTPSSPRARCASARSPARRCCTATARRTSSRRRTCAPSATSASTAATRCAPTWRATAASGPTSAPPATRASTTPPTSRYDTTTVLLLHDTRQAAHVLGVPAHVRQQDAAVPPPPDALRAEDAPVLRLRQALLQRLRAALPHGAPPRRAALRLLHLQQELLQPHRPQGTTPLPCYCYTIHAKQPTCSVCQRTFASKTLLYRHRQTHFEQKTHLCSVCDKRFYSGYALRSHMARHRGERPYVCSTCNKSFYNPTDLKVRHHYRVTATRYTPSSPRARCASARSPARRCCTATARRTSSRRRTCAPSATSASTAATRCAPTWRATAASGPTSAPPATRASTTPPTSRYDTTTVLLLHDTRQAAHVLGVPAHVRQQDAAVPPPPDALRAEDAPVLRLRQALLQRLRAALPHGAPPRRAALRLLHLQQELLQPHRPQGTTPLPCYCYTIHAKQPTCSVCQRTFASKTLLYRHRQTHFEQKTHLCSVCDKRFYSGYALRSHMARHRGERPYVCSTCNKSFYNPTDLKVRHHYRVTATRYTPSSPRARCASARSPARRCCTATARRTSSRRRTCAPSATSASTAATRCAPTWRATAASGPTSAPPATRASTTPPTSRYDTTTVLLLHDTRQAAHVLGVPAHVRQQDAAVPPPPDALRAEDAPVLRLRQALLQRLRAALPHGAPPRRAALRLLHLQQELLQPHRPQGTTPLPCYCYTIHAKQPTCSVCQRTFASKTLLYRHRQTHFEQKTHLCSVCDKRFYSGYALRSHMARHRGERPYVCSTCNKSFYNPTDLKVRHHYRVTATRYTPSSPRARCASARSPARRCCTATARRTSSRRRTCAPSATSASTAATRCAPTWRATAASGPTSAPPATRASTTPPTSRSTSACTLVRSR